MAMRVCVFRGGYHSLTSHIAPGKNPDSGCLRCQWEVPKVMYIQKYHLPKTPMKNRDASSPAKDFVTPDNVIICAHAREREKSQQLEVKWSEYGLQRRKTKGKQIINLQYPSILPVYQYTRSDV